MSVRARVGRVGNTWNYEVRRYAGGFSEVVVDGCDTSWLLAYNRAFRAVGTIGFNDYLTDNADLGPNEGESPPAARRHAIAVRST